MLAHLEQFVGVPADNATLQSAPAPFCYAGDDLGEEESQGRGSDGGPGEGPTMGSVMRRSCASASPRICCWLSK